MTTQAAEKVHWRAMHDSNSEDFGSPDLLTILEREKVKELHVRIISATGGSVEDSETRKAKKRVAFRFAGIDKPYKSNVTNNNAARSVTGSPYPVDWAGHVVTIYVSKATRPKRKGDPEDAPNMVVVDAIRFKSTKPPQGAKVYRETEANGAAFDADGWCAAFADVPTREEFNELREKLNKAKAPASARAVLAKAVEAARVRLFTGEP